MKLTNTEKINLNSLKSVLEERTGVRVVQATITFTPATAATVPLLSVRAEYSDGSVLVLEGVA